jgi:hypothetical protein
VASGGRCICQVGYLLYGLRYVIQVSNPVPRTGGSLKIEPEAYRVD